MVMVVSQERENQNTRATRSGLCAGKGDVTMSHGKTLAQVFNLRFAQGALLGVFAVQLVMMFFRTEKSNHNTPDWRVTT